MPGSPIVIVRPPEATGPGDLATYAPALPTVAVALIGLWVVHKLTLRRDRRKEALELCDRLCALADAAVETATEAWQVPKGRKRALAVAHAIRQLQAVGMAATDLANRARRRNLARTVKEWRWPQLRQRLTRERSLLAYDHANVLGEVIALRRCATADPFEDPDRPASSKPVRDLQLALGRLCLRAHQEIDRLYP